MLLRLSIFKLSKKRTLLSPPHPEREQPPLDDDQEVQKRTKNIWQGKRTGFSHPNINSLQRNGTANLDHKPYILSKVLDRDAACRAENLVTRLEGLGTFAEILYIVRPVVYVLALRKYGFKSWTPWTFSLFLEWFSLHLKNKYLQNRGGLNTLSSLEKEEKRRRSMILGYYLLKGPFFNAVTKPFLMKFCENTKNKFMLSFMAGMILDYIPLWEKFHFYTSGS
ncbi:hypothetical protein DSO57_1011011 [Entomophthora muscae]|uniref:Uncharacterized protein n=1 Tax=Entomophthora muscae TaxID=34485 RepID=A0ACC2S8E6_9FUNG|nr:hypothetical protein DSO57_1011011 [Entomophthora muscae]